MCQNLEITTGVQIFNEILLEIGFIEKMRTT